METLSKPTSMTNAHSTAGNASKFEELEEAWDTHCRYSYKGSTELEYIDFEKARIRLNDLGVVWGLDCITINNCIMLVRPT